MKLDFCFKNQIDELFKDDYFIDFDMNEAKGLTIHTPKKPTFILINLSCYKWTDLHSISEDFLVTSMCRTITHETIHYILNTKTIKPIGYTRKGEEDVCLIMACQK